MVEVWADSGLLLDAVESFVFTSNHLAGVMSEGLGCWTRPMKRIVPETMLTTLYVQSVEMVKLSLNGNDRRLCLSSGAV
jgi:hypothetical protein